MMAYGEPSPFRRVEDKDEGMEREVKPTPLPQQQAQTQTQPQSPPTEPQPGPGPEQQQQYSSLITEPTATTVEHPSKHRQSGVGQVTCALSTTGLGSENGRGQVQTTQIDDEVGEEEDIDESEEDTSQQSISSHVLLPQSFFDCPIEHLIILVSSMLEELVSVNDALPFDPAQLTRFHSRSPPGISIKDYLIRIVRFCSLEKSILLTVIYYIDFLCRTFSTFNINSLTVHRFLITTCMVGSKGLCDSFRTNGHYARVGGISKAELNLLEVEFLVRVDYRIVPKVEVLSRYYERMVMRMNNVYQLVEGISSSTPAGTTPSDTPTATTQLPSVVATTESRRGVGNVKRGSIDEGDSERVKRSLEGKEP
ncbi:cyclin-domain-containing protein [Yarrowia lipolytica]|jgi:hypothetical protein|uniref:YALI0D21472p n=2 Tax=Yarrowia lipolytica TaxID=4952 RepID=Q6C899_YARLI|nr:YALI0D21472p [Yarrowia lipolytica CLIB122]RDW24217.1 cyclin-domain-containing protein [Yarrowia lipolytica]RDW33291.1 cyclin-domain-containing protein [Yarrowia lipolytica]RDW40725.1 cyclin-domain-containing protein [Yarrowia lipolytica]RDW46890.1 cyclin-domain-containing protein [Yarrowia lipolytica]RDW53897.1 cyclin-domain-containing protein [Yarrowia lipolytica]|eukprot:XP_503113.1 YALI0D21472p [Yarrowia lipolytica CLIB122]